eukprot:3827418-Prymnesium_polylepis.1
MAPRRLRAAASSGELQTTRRTASHVAAAACVAPAGERGIVSGSGRGSRPVESCGPRACRGHASCCAASTLGSRCVRPSAHGLAGSGGVHGSP